MSDVTPQPDPALDLRRWRGAHALSPARAAELLGVTPEAVEDFEAGVSSDAARDVAYHARRTVPTSPSQASPRAVLDAHAAQLGCFDDRAPLLRHARDILELDELLVVVDSAFHPAQAPLAPALAASTLPALEGPGRRPAPDSRHDRWTLDYRADGRELGRLLRTQMQLGAGQPGDPFTAAAACGVHIAGAPAPSTRLRSLTVTTGAAPLVVLNTSLHRAVGRTAAAHALGHLLAGDLLGPGTADWMPEQDDDSIYCCTDLEWPLCLRADAFAQALLAPAPLLRAALDNAHEFSTRKRSRREVVAELVPDLAEALELTPDFIAAAVLDVADLGRKQTWAVQRQLVRRRPFGVTSRSSRSSRADAFTHDDLTLPDGPGHTFMPAGLLERALAVTRRELAEDRLWRVQPLLVRDAHLDPVEREQFLTAAAASRVWSEPLLGAAAADSPMLRHLLDRVTDTASGS